MVSVLGNLPVTSRFQSQRASNGDRGLIFFCQQEVAGRKVVELLQFEMHEIYVTMSIAVNVWTINLLITYNPVAMEMFFLFPW